MRGLKGPDMRSSMMRNRASVAMAIVGAALLTVSGCASMSGLETPHIQLAGIRLQEMKGFENVFQVDLRVVNPNDTALPIRGVELDLALEGRNIAKGVSNPQKEIAAYSSEIVPVTVYASMLGMLDIAQRLVRGLQQGNLAEKWNYAVSGHMRIGQSEWLGKIPFNSKGQIDLEELTAPLREK
jgi:LEA14-like dessication related protein